MSVLPIGIVSKGKIVSFTIRPSCAGSNTSQQSGPPSYPAFSSRFSFLPIALQEFGGRRKEFFPADEI
jgi:hypothetical protein